MKKLPVPQKNLRNFILGEDAKIIDKTVVKIALTATFGAFMITGVYAGGGGGGGGSYVHSNNMVVTGSPTQTGGANVNVDHNLTNVGNSSYQNTYSSGGKSISVDVPPGAVQTAHANHYNFVPSGGKK